MTLTSLAKRTEKLVLDNSPTILTAIGVTGTVTTALLVGKASFRAAQILEREASIRAMQDQLEPREKFDLVWKMYIPAVGVGCTTIVCIIGANRIGSRRAAAMAAAYSIAEKGFVEYKEKVIEKFGEAKETQVRDEIAQDRVTRNPPKDSEIIITGAGEVLFVDTLTGRYFQSTVETVKKAQNDINYQIIHCMYASLSEFYDKLGLAPTPYSEEVGWTTDEMLEVTFSACLTDDQRPCISLDYVVTPTRGYDRLR